MMNECIGLHTVRTLMSEKKCSSLIENKYAVKIRSQRFKFLILQFVMRLLKFLKSTSLSWILYVAVQGECATLTKLSLK